MAGLNKVLLIGYLGEDAELRSTNSGTSVLKWRMATTEVWKDASGEKKERTEWHSCVLWGKRGEALANYMEKGKQVYVEGSLRTSSYEDREGVKRYKTEVNVSEVLFVGGGKRREVEDIDGDDEPQERRHGGGGGGKGKSQQQKQEEHRKKYNADDFDEIPF